MVRCVEVIKLLGGVAICKNLMCGMDTDLHTYEYQLNAVLCLFFAFLLLLK